VHAGNSVGALLHHEHLGTREEQRSGAEVVKKRGAKSQDHAKEDDWPAPRGDLSEVEARSVGPRRRVLLGPVPHHSPPQSRPESADSVLVGCAWSTRTGMVISHRVGFPLSSVT